AASDSGTLRSGTSVGSEPSSASSGLARSVITSAKAQSRVLGRGIALTPFLGGASPLRAKPISEEDVLKNLFSVEGKVAVVTGGSRGIGEMIARGLVHAG